MLYGEPSRHRVLPPARPGSAPAVGFAPNKIRPGVRSRLLQGRSTNLHHSNTGAKQRGGSTEEEVCEILAMPFGASQKNTRHLPGRLFSLVLIFLIGTGARMAEAIELEWRDVDLIGARAIFWRTKGRKRRDAQLPPRVIAALANLPHREGPVFRWETKRDKEGRVRRVSTYADRERRSGGHIRTGFAGVLRRRPRSRIHGARSAPQLGQLALRAAQGSAAAKNRGRLVERLLVERYAHLLPAGQEEAIKRF